MNARRAAVPLLLTAAAAALVYTLYRQERPTHPVQMTAGLPQYTLDGVDLTRFGTDGTPTLRAHAARIDDYRDGRAVAQALRVTVLRGTGTPWTATAPEGTLTGKRQPLRLTGGVRLLGHWPDSGQPLRIDTESLWIDPGNHELWTDTSVALTSPARNGSATGLRGDWLSRNLDLLGDVRMQYDVPPR